MLTPPLNHVSKVALNYFKGGELSSQMQWFVIAKIEL